MGFFGRIFGKSDAEVTRKAKEAIRKAERSTKEHQEKAAPFRRLSSAIIHAASECQKRITPLIHGDTADTEEERLVREMRCLFEFLYFFMHMTNREAFSKLGAERRNKLQEIICPDVAGVAVDSFMEHFPVEKKKQVRALFYDRMNAADSDYGSAKEWLSRENFAHCVLGRLGFNVDQAIGSDNPEIAMKSVDVACAEMRSSNIDQLVEATRNVIDDFEVSKYDPWDDPSYPSQHSE
jgi:hypothetical protein